jgi:spermidine synthase
MESANSWFLEKRGPSDWHYYGIKRILLEERSDFQLIQVFDTYDYGICLALDGKARVFSIDEFIFHEAMIHPIMSHHPHPKNILLAGDGDGGSVREILRYNVDQLTWIELDKRVVDISNQYLKLVTESMLSERPVNLVLQNARENIRNSDQKYDIIFVSVTEPLKDNPSQQLYTCEFLKEAKLKLAPNGYIVQSIGCTSFGYLKQYCQMVNTYKEVFDFVSPYHVGLPSFGVSWGFVVATQNPKIPNIQTFSNPRVSDKLKFYGEATHLALFALPTYLLDAITEFTQISTDENPIWVY